MKPSLSVQINKLKLLVQHCILRFQRLGSNRFFSQNHTYSLEFKKEPSETLLRLGHKYFKEFLSRQNKSNICNKTNKRDMRLKKKQIWLW